MRVLVFCLWLVHWLPLPVLGRVGEAAGSVVFRLAARRRHIALTNLALCFPQWSAARRRAVAHQHFRAYMRSVVERGILWWSGEKRLRKLIVCKPGLPLAQIRMRPTILLCPHFVSLDAAGVAIGMATSGCSMYSRQSSPVLDKALRKGRSRFHPVSLFSRSEGVKPILRAMRQGLPFFMCPDMDFGARDSAFVPFFGVSAATLLAPARIAALMGAQVIPVVATVLPNYRGWSIEFMEPWKDYPGSDPAHAARRMNQFIEQQISKTPHEYFWSHRRFKTRPAGEVDVYARPSPQPAEEPAIANYCA